MDDVYHTILLHHPGPYNKDDPHFLKTLEHAYSKAKEGLQRASRAPYDRTVLTRFTDAFEDPHLGISWGDQKSSNTAPSRRQGFLVEKFGSGLWVHIPTFFIQEKQMPRFRLMLKDLSRRKLSSYIIFDLRGNQGGNSDFGSRIINVVFGTRYASQKRCEANKEVMVSWRVSQENRDHILKLHHQYPDQDWLQKVSDGLSLGLLQGKRLYREHPYQSCKVLSLEPIEHNELKVVIVIDAHNVSAALDFIDEVKMMTADVVLIGQQTQADRMYMEVRSVPLPSGRGKLFFPIKVYHHRPRLDKQAYVPDIFFDKVHDTPALKNFVRKALDRDQSIRQLP